MAYLTRDDIERRNAMGQRKSFAPYLRVSNETMFGTNGLRFEHLEDCERYLNHKKNTWFLVEDTLPCVTDDEPNYFYQDDVLVEITNS